MILQVFGRAAIRISVRCVAARGCRTGLTAPTVAVALRARLRWGVELDGARRRNRAAAATARAPSAAGGAAAAVAAAMAICAE